MPNSSAANIALAKKSKIVTGSEMPCFFAAKPKANCSDPAHSILARAVKVPVHIPLSGKKIGFDASGKRPTGC